MINPYFQYEFCPRPESYLTDSGEDNFLSTEVKTQKQNKFSNNIEISGIRHELVATEEER